MKSPPSGLDPEVAAIAAVSTALAELADPEARRRVLAYVMARFGIGLAVSRSSTERNLPVAPASLESRSDEAQPVDAAPLSGEIPGIARLTANGDLKITVRDLKAKSGLDAAVRLAHVAIYAYGKLRGGEPLSSRRALTPILREWRLYDGNTRSRLAKEKGIIRDGDALHLDAHSRRDAERYIQEILDDGLSGTWRPH